MLRGPDRTRIKAIASRKRPIAAQSTLAESVPMTTATKALSSDAVFSPFLTALPNSVQYPSDTAWANEKTKIQQTIGTAVTGDPQTVLSQLEQSATAAS